MELDLSEKLNNIQDKLDMRISLALMASFVILTIQYFVLIYFNLIDTSTGLSIQLLSKGLVGLAYLYALPSVIKRSLNKFLLSYFIAIFIFLLHYAVFQDNRPYMESVLVPFFFMCLPAFTYALSIRNFEIFKDVMKKSSLIVFCFGVLIGTLVFFGEISIGSYSMGLSYYMLLPTIMFIDEFMNRFSAKMLLLVMLSLLIILALGSRGAILCMVVFMLLKYLKPSTNRTYKRIIGHFSVVGVGALILIGLEKMMISLYNFLLLFGVNSRTLNLFLSGKIDLSNRDHIYQNVINGILESPIIGIGIAGDSRIGDGTYVHNLFLEIIGNFGIILGSFLSIALILLIMKSLFTKDIFKYNLFIIWLSLGFVHLMVSSSYLIDIRFWIFLGLIINFIKRKEPIIYEGIKLYAIKH